jgi:hypothetical protein
LYPLVEHGPIYFAESKVHKEQQREEYGHGDIDPVIVKKIYVHERLAREMKQSEIDCEALPPGSHPIERRPYYSHTFPMSPILITNKGLVNTRQKYRLSPFIGEELRACRTYIQFHCGMVLCNIIRSTT